MNRLKIILLFEVISREINMLFLVILFHINTRSRSVNNCIIYIYIYVTNPHYLFNYCITIILISLLNRRSSLVQIINKNNCGFNRVIRYYCNRLSLENKIYLSMCTYNYIICCTALIYAYLKFSCYHFDLYKSSKLLYRFHLFLSNLNSSYG